MSEPQANYTVLARRYRPAGFDQLIGQEHVARALKNAVSSGRVAHAYLFTGVRGVGKTSIARIMAKALNCVKGPTPDPCGECESCLAIAQGQDVDVLEIDGASNRRIEEIRDIRTNVQYKPSRSRFKIFIIDEVHMLTEQAFNALLKTLEEPPAHVKFFFATTDPQDIPITILSRCQRFDLPGIAQDRILAHLESIVKKEGMKADSDALRLIARRAGGSMRDAQSLLDQLLAFSGGELGIEQVRRLLGSADDDRLGQFASAIIQADVPALMDLVERCIVEGLPLVELLDQLLAYWRDLMVLQCAGAKAPGLTIGPVLKEKALEQAKGLQLDQISAGMDLLATTRSRLKTSSLPRALLEVCLVRLARLRDLIPITQLAQAVSQGNALPVAATTTAPPRPALSSAPASAEGPLKKNDLKPLPEAVAPPPVLTAAPSGMELPLTSDSLVSVWAETLEKIGGLLERDLRKGQPRLISDRAIALTFPSSAESSWYNCQEPARIKRVEESLKLVTGQDCTLRVERGPGGTEGSPAESSNDKPAGPNTETVMTGRESLARAELNPVVKRAVELFDGKVVRVDPGFGDE